MSTTIRKNDQTAWAKSTSSALQTDKRQDSRSILPQRFNSTSQPRKASIVRPEFNSVSKPKPQR